MNQRLAIGLLIAASLAALGAGCGAVPAPKSNAYPGKEPYVSPTSPPPAARVPNR